MDTPPPDDLPPPPIILPAADLPPMSEAEDVPVTILQPASQPISRRTLGLIVGGISFVTFVIVLGFFYREAWIFLLLAGIIPPMAVLPLLAYAGEQQPIARVFAFIVWLGVIGGTGVNSFVTAAESDSVGGHDPNCVDSSWHRRGSSPRIAVLFAYDSSRRGSPSTA